MAGGLLPQPKQLVQDNAWNPGIAYQLYTYEPASLTPKTTYQDQALTIANTNPVVANARGEVVMYGAGSHRIILKDSLGNTIWDRDNIDALVGGTSLAGGAGAALVGYDDTTLDVVIGTRLERAVNTVAAVRALSKTKYLRAVASGYYAPGDGGGGAYYYDAADTSSADNGGTVIVASDGGRWKLVHNGTVSVRQFGAKGIGLTFDDTASVQAAIASGLTVYVPKTAAFYYLKTAVNLTKPGQLIYGDGKDATVFKCDTAFNMSATGVFVFNTASQQGPVMRDLKITFVQPDTGVRASLTTYPPAIYAQESFRFILRDVLISHASTCIDARGNAGGAVLDNLSLSAYNFHVRLDGATDSVKLDKVHFWPFDMSTSQTTIYYEPACVGLESGRCDDLHIDNCIFICGTQAKFIQTAGGTTFGNIVNTDFDTNNGIVLQYGTISLSGCYFSTGFAAGQWVKQTGGILNMSSCYFTAAVGTTSPALQVYGNNSSPVCNVSTAFFNLGTADFVAAQVGALAGVASLTITGSTVSRASNITPAAPAIEQIPNGRLSFVGNRGTDAGTGTGNLVRLNADDYSIVSQNWFGGWGLFLPTGYTKLKCDGNTTLAGLDRLNNMVVGNVRVVSLYTNLDGSGNATVAHGILSGNQKVMTIAAYCKGNSGEATPVTVNYMDASNVSIAGGGGNASRAARVTISYMETSQGW